MPLSSGSGNVFNLDNRYISKVEYVAYNTKGKLTHARDQTNRNYAIKYAHNELLPVAFAQNAAPDQVFYNGYEEAPAGSSTESKFGKYGYGGVVTIPGAALTAGTYLATWWEFDPVFNKWQFKSQGITANGFLNMVIPTTGTVDEVTVRPFASSISTFSYDPGVGLISKVQDNGTGLKFNFDSMGRLITIRDHQENILKINSYQYQQVQ